MGKSLEILFPSEFAASSMDMIRKTLTGERWETVEIKILNLDGTVRTVLWNSATLFAPDGTTPVATIAQGQDITDRKLAEVALQALQEKYYKTFNFAPTLISLTDLTDGRIIEVNDQYCEVLGYTRGDLLGNTTLSLGIITPECRRRLVDLLQKPNGGPQKVEFSIHTKTGQTIPILFSGSMIQFGGQRILISIFLDISELKRAEKDKLKIQAELQQSHKMESLGLLVAGVAHNINNVLAIAMGTASLREDAVTEPADRQAYQRIGIACRRGRDVVKSLIHFAQPSLSNQAPIELNSMIIEVCALLESTTRNRIKIIESLSEELLWINANSGDIDYILVNIGVNSMDAMPDGGTLTFRTTILDGNWVEVTIEDNGLGMTPEVLAHVMEPFYTTKEVDKGTGLGLSMAYGVIKAHGGTIDIASQPGQGTAVKLRFPRIPAPVESKPGPANAPALLPKLRKVLLVDDEEDVRFLMTRMLKKAGIGEVETAAGGEEATEKLLSGELPDLIILDLNMPGLNGTQTLKLIRQLCPDLPILISSGQPEIEECPDFKQPKVGVISKPFTMGEIQTRLAQFAHEPISANKYELLRSSSSTMLPLKK